MADNASKRTSVECQLNGHDWHRPMTNGKRRSGWKHCWRCGRRRRKT